MLGVEDLNRDQLTELKQHYYTELLDERGESPSYDELVRIDELVSDQTIFDEYENTEFTNDDFFCSAGEPEEEYFSLDLGDCHGTRIDIAQDLRQIANEIENENYGGVAYYGTSWGLDRD